MKTTKARILVIDPDAEVLGAVDGAIDGRFDGAVAADLAGALTHLALGGFDVILCDAQIPGKSGLSLVEDLLTEQPDVAVVPVARVDDTAAVERAVEFSEYGYLLKPFSSEQLAATAEVALQLQDLDAAQRKGRRNRDLQVRMVMEHAPVPIFVKDLERRYLLVNRFAHEVLRLEPGEMIGRTDAEILSPENEGLIRESDIQVLEHQESSYREVTLELDGRDRTFLTIKFPYIDAEGRLAGIIGITTESWPRQRPRASAKAASDSAALEQRRRQVDEEPNRQADDV